MTSALESPRPASSFTREVRRVVTPTSGEIQLYLLSPAALVGRDTFGRLLSPSGASLIREIAAEITCGDAGCHPIRGSGKADGRSQCTACGRWYSVTHSTTEERVSTAVAVAGYPVGVDVQFERRRAGALRGLARMTGRDVATIGWPDWVATEALIKAQGRAGVRPAHGAVALPPMELNHWTRVENDWHVLVESLGDELWLSLAIHAPSHQ